MVLKDKSNIIIMEVHSSSWAILTVGINYLYNFNFHNDKQIKIHLCRKWRVAMSNAGERVKMALQIILDQVIVATKFLWVKREHEYTQWKNELDHTNSWALHLAV